MSFFKLHSRKYKVFYISGFLLIFFPAFVYLIIQKANWVRYPYNVTRDYQYDFSKSDSQIINIKIVNNSINIRNINFDDKSIFLKLQVQASIFLGSIFTPYIHASSAGIHSSTALEKNASGIRYINLSKFANHALSTIDIKLKYLTLDSQDAQLIIFNNRAIDEKKILIISPHPDDAEIAAYGLYSNNKNSVILTITAGEAGLSRYDELYTDNSSKYLKIGQLRTWNSITVPLLAGLRPDNLLNLGYFDSTLKEMHKDKFITTKGRYTNSLDINLFRKQNISPLSSLLDGDSNWSSYVGNMEKILNKVKPDIIVTPYPLIDNHTDHKYSTLALFEAIKNIGMHSGELFFYTNHYALTEYYPFGEQGESVTLPPNFDDNLYARRLYSFNVSESLQIDKLLAFDAMIDLRPDTHWRFWEDHIKIAAKIFERKVRDLEKSYFRRAVRENELFYVMSVEDIYSDSLVKRIMGNL